MIRRLFSSQLSQNVSISMVVFGINFIISLVALPIYLHYLGYEKYGVWLVLTTVMTFAELGNLGISPAITKYVAENYEQSDKESIERYVTTAIYSLSVSGGVILLMIFCFGSQIISAFKLGSENSALAMHLLPYVGILTLYVFIVQVVAATLSGLNRMDLTGCFQLAGRVLAVTIAALLLHGGNGVQSLLIAHCLSSLIYHTLCFIAVQHIIQIRFSRVTNFDGSSLKQLVRFGGGVMGGRILGMFLIPFNKLMISRFIGVQAIPIYDISYNIAMNIRGIAASGLGALTPEVSRLSVLASSGRRKIGQIYRKAMVLISLFGIPVFLTVFILATPILQLWLQEKFHPLLPIMVRILLAATFLDLLGTPSFYTILGLGRSDSIFFSSLIKSGLNFLVIFLIVVATGTLSLQAIAWTGVIGMGCSTCFLLLQPQTASKATEESTLI